MPVFQQPWAFLLLLCIPVLYLFRKFFALFHFLLVFLLIFFVFILVVIVREAFGR